MQTPNVDPTFKFRYHLIERVYNCIPLIQSNNNALWWHGSYINHLGHLAGEVKNKALPSRKDWEWGVRQSSHFCSVVGYFAKFFIFVWPIADNCLVPWVLISQALTVLMINITEEQLDWVAEVVPRFDVGMPVIETLIQASWWFWVCRSALTLGGGAGSKPL